MDKFKKKIQEQAKERQLEAGKEFGKAKKCSYRQRNCKDGWCWNWYKEFQ